MVFPLTPSRATSSSRNQPYAICDMDQGTGRPGVPMYRSVRSFISDARHNYLLAVPAVRVVVHREGGGG